MGQLVASFGASHTALMIREFQAAPKAQRHRVMGGFEAMRSTLVAASPDVLVVVGSDHMKTFFLDNMPTFCLGVGDTCEGWADAGIPKYRVKVHQPLARTLLGAALTDGFDLAFSEEMPLDHGFFGPLHFLTPEMDLPVVPLFVNSAVSPQPSLRRCYDLGMFIGQVIRQLFQDVRVAILGTGGLSHWVGIPGMGRIHERFDRWALDLMASGGGKELCQLTSEQLEREAGNGGHELRNWLVMLGATGSYPAKFQFYEPVREWATGIALLVMDI